jgi:hypothetical protein
MSKNDELDRRRAAAFAWRFTRPGEAVDLPEDEPADAQEMPVGGYETAAGTQDPAHQAASARDKREPPDVCANLTDAIEQVRRNAEIELFTALAPLLLRAGDVALEIFNMEGYPWQSDRLCERASYCRLGPGETSWGPATAAGPPYGNRKRLELVLELARTQALSSLTSLMLAISGGRCARVARAQAAAVRVARLLDDGPGHIARCVPEDALSDEHARRVLVPVLRRALRSRHFLRRCRALELLDRHFPDAILPADVCFLLHDMVLHALPEYHDDEELTQAESSFLALLERALVRLRPLDALEPLVHMIQGACARRQTDPSFGDVAWALRMLAILAPEAAAPHIDRQLAQAPWLWRDMALDAVRRLPEELARPRLLLAAADGVPEIAEQAQAIWRERYGEACPFDPLSGIELALLEGPPSEQMRARLAVLRGGSFEARAAMVGQLLDEAPDPEAFVLLLFTALDRRVWPHRMGLDDDGSPASFFRVLAARFGPLVIDGLLALADRHSKGEHDWLRQLALLVTSGAISEAAYPRLRAAAVHHWSDTDKWTRKFVLAIIAHIGPPHELDERHWQVALDPAESGGMRAAAARALARLPAGDERRDAAVLAKMEGAYAMPDMPRFARAAAVGFACALPAAFDLAERALAEVGATRPEDPLVIAALAACVEGLTAAGRLSDNFVIEALGRPGTYLCAAAARHARSHAVQTSEAEVLFTVLGGDDPVCAAEAALTLVSGGAMSPHHPALFGIARRAPRAPRAWLVHMMRSRGASWSYLWPLLEPLLSSTDPAVHDALYCMSSKFTSEGLPKKLRPLLSRVLDPALRRHLERTLAWGNDGYWKDQQK